MPGKTIGLRLSALLLCGWTAGWMPEARGEGSEKSVEVTLEMRHGDTWQAIDPHVVLHANDEIRFRFRSAQTGYLYVFGVSNSGKSGWLYPRPTQGQNNRVEPGRNYVIPGLDGSFSIGGMPGYDITYWLVSPTTMDVRDPYLPPADGQPNTLRPRCGETLQKARGLCMDERAGPGPVQELKMVPLPLGNDSRGLVARDLTFHSQQESTRIAAPESSSGLIVYQFLIAHI